MLRPMLCAWLERNVAQCSVAPSLAVAKELTLHALHHCTILVVYFFRLVVQIALNLSDCTVPGLEIPLAQKLQLLLLCSIVG